MTPYKSMLIGACARIGPQECLTYSHLHPLHGMSCYGRGHLLAPFCYSPVSHYARHLEKPPSPHPVLARLHASSIPRAENLGRTRSLDPGGHHGVAFPPLVEGVVYQADLKIAKNAPTIPQLSEDSER